MQKKTSCLFPFLCHFHTFLNDLLKTFVFFLCFLLHLGEDVKWKMTKKNKTGKKITKKEKNRGFSHAVLFIVCYYRDNSGFCQSDAPKFPPPAECSVCHLYKITTIIPTSCILSSPSLIRFFRYYSTMLNHRDVSAVEGFTSM